MKIEIKDWKPFLLKDLYNIKLGNKFDKDKMSTENPTVNFVSRISYNNGVDLKVDKINKIEPYPSGYLTVALGGSYLGSCFVQEEPFYTGQNVAVLEPKDKRINRLVNLFISTIIRYESKIKYYAFGRELNSHICTDFEIKLPAIKESSKDKTLSSKNGYLPNWSLMENFVKDLHHKPLLTHRASSNQISFKGWEEFTLNKLFTLQGGFFNKKPEKTIIGKIPYLGATETNNGVTDYLSIEDIKEWGKNGSKDYTLEGKMFKGNCIAVTVNGSVCNAFYQHDDFTCSHDITVLRLRGRKLNVYLAMFLCTIISNEKYRWSYGRKPHDVAKFGESILKLPIMRDNAGMPIIDESYFYNPKGYIPNWDYMENSIKMMSYGDKLS